jgi:hypothetical protein
MFPIMACAWAICACNVAGSMVAICPHRMRIHLQSRCLVSRTQQVLHRRCPKPKTAPTEYTCPHKKKCKRTSVRAERPAVFSMQTAHCVSSTQDNQDGVGPPRATSSREGRVANTVDWGQNVGERRPDAAWQPFAQASYSPSAPALISSSPDWTWRPSFYWTCASLKSKKSFFWKNGKFLFFFRLLCKIERWCDTVS